MAAPLDQQGVLLGLLRDRGRMMMLLWQGFVLAKRYGIGVEAAWNDFASQLREIHDPTRSPQEG